MQRIIDENVHQAFTYHDVQCEALLEWHVETAEQFGDVIAGLFKGAKESQTLLWFTCGQEDPFVAASFVAAVKGDSGFSGFGASCDPQTHLE